MKKISQTEIQNLMALHQRGLDDDLISKATSLVREYPEEIILFNLLGVSFERKGSLKNAAKAYKSALKINPNITVRFQSSNFDISKDINIFDIIFDCSDNQETKYALNYL